MRHPAYPLRKQRSEGMSEDSGVVWNPRNGGHFALQRSKPGESHPKLDGNKGLTGTQGSRITGSQRRIGIRNGFVSMERELIPGVSGP